jgi:hypothetical protein
MMVDRLPRSRIMAGACVLLFVALTPAFAQFPPPPGQRQAPAQDGAFPPPPGQPAAPRQDTAFPSPPGAGAPAASQSAFPAAPGGIGSSGGGFGGPVAPGGFGGGAPAQPSEAQRICLTFPAIREDMEKTGIKIREASARKATREEVCPLFKEIVVKETKMIKFLEANRQLCGVPLDAINQMKSNHANTTKIRNVVCSAGPAGPAPGPTLSDALGGPIIADDTSAKQPGRGTFDTLTGNALQR